MPSADFFLAVRGNRFPLSQFLPHAESQFTGKISRGKTQNIPRIDAEFIKHTPMGKSVRRPSVCATGLPSLPRALGLGATLRCQAPPAPPSAALRSSHTPARPQWLYGAMWLLLRPSPRAYLVLRAFASLSMARSVCSLDGAQRL